MTVLNRTVRFALLAVGLLVVATACAFPQQGTDSTESIDGTYYVNGVDGRGIEYGGRLEITPGDQPDHYAMQWIITGSVQVGTSVKDGNQLEAKWSTVEGLVNQDGTDRSQGTASYTIASDGTLTGTRTIDGQNEPGTEEAFPVKP